MTVIIRLLTAGALLSASVHALTVSHGEVLARHRRVANVESGAEDLVEKDVAVELEERGTGKVGMAWANNEESNIHKFVSPHTKYLYTWSPFCPAPAAEHGLECCPMLWGTKQIGQFEQNKYKGGKCIMGMNEVNVPSQGYISVSEGIELWNKYIRPMASKGYYLISPSVTSGTSGLDWLRQFFQECGGPGSYCEASGTNMHYYGTNVNDFINWANRFHKLMPHGDVWVTEIACQNFGDPSKGQCDQGHVWQFMDGVTSWMDHTSWVKAYFYFGMSWDMYNVNPTNRLVDSSGGPNALGHHYVKHS